MDNVMQGYDLDAAVRQIGKAIGESRARRGGGFRAARHRGRHALYA